MIVSLDPTPFFPFMLLKSISKDGLTIPFDNCSDIAFIFLLISSKCCSNSFPICFGLKNSCVITLIGVRCCSDFKRIISIFSRRISSLNTSIFEDNDSSLINAFTFTILALFAKFKVDNVSWKLNAILETAAIMMVFEFPPKESLSRHVNFESLYGMWFRGFSLVNAFITIPKVVSDLLIFEAYLSRSPEAWVIFCL